jgi:hypothetical protein
VEPERLDHADRVESARGRGPAAPPPDDEVRPLGALAVTGFLTLVIFAAWFGMFALNLSRS